MHLYIYICIYIYIYIYIYAYNVIQIYARGVTAIADILDTHGLRAVAQIFLINT